MTTRDRPPYNSGGWLDATTIVLNVPRGPLEQRLRALGLSLLPHPDAPAGMHPLLIDLWRVHRGRLELGELDQHQAAARAGTVAGTAWGIPLGGLLGAGLGGLAGAVSAGQKAGETRDPLGQWWATMLGWANGAAAGWSRGAAETAAGLGRAGGEMATSFSRAASTTIGTYNEVLVGIPNVLGRDRGCEPHLFVLGMYANSPVAIFGDRGLGTGYGKRLAQIRHSGFAGYEVRAPVGACLSAQFSAAPPTCWNSVAATPGLTDLRSWFAQPLLGHDGRRGLARSHLDRALEAPGVRCAVGEGQLTIGRNFMPGVPAGTHALPGQDGPIDRGGILHVSQMLTRVTYPRTF